MEHTYNASDQHYDKREGFFACACLGPVHGEPFCPCSMAFQRLPKSKEHVEYDKGEPERRKAFFEALRPYVNKA